MRTSGKILLTVILAIPSLSRAGIDTAWVRTFTSPGTHNEESRVVLPDDGGGAFISGGPVSPELSGMTTIRYDEFGAPTWTIEESMGYSIARPRAIAAGPAGSAYVAGLLADPAVHFGGVAMKYKHDGSMDWSFEFPYPDHSSNARAIHVDASGNVIVAGFRVSSFTPGEFVTLKFGPDGALLWERFFAPEGQLVEVNHLSVSPSGEIFVCGRVLYDEDDIYLVKYSSGGVFQWGRRFDGPQYRGYDGASQMRAADDGSVLVGGWSESDAILLRYSAIGDLIWEEHFVRAGATTSWLKDFELLADGTITALGGSDLPGVTMYRYAPDGSLQWETYAAQSDASTENPVALAVDTEGNSYVVASTQTAPDPFTDIFLLKYNSEGALVSSLIYGTVNRHELPASLALDATNQIYVTGRQQSVDGDYNFLTIKYSNPTELAVDILPRSCPNILNTGSSEIDYQRVRPSAAAARPATVSVAILGTKTFDLNRVDPATIEIAGLAPVSHRLIDVSRPVESRESDCECTTAGEDGFVDLVLYFDQAQLLAALAPITDGDMKTIALSGKTKTGVPLSGSDCVTIKEGAIRYSPLASAGEKVETGFAAYPNPFNAATVVSFSLSSDSDVRLEVYDVLGRRVATLVEGLMPAGEHQVSWDAAGVSSGVYFARLATSAGMMTRKMVLVR